jgi:hypothetical protein
LAQPNCDFPSPSPATMMLLSITIPKPNQIIITALIVI